MDGRRTNHLCSARFRKGSCCWSFILCASSFTPCSKLCLSKWVSSFFQHQWRHGSTTKHSAKEIGLHCTVSLLWEQYSRNFLTLQFCLSGQVDWRRRRCLPSFDDVQSCTKHERLLNMCTCILQQSAVILWTAVTADKFQAFSLPIFLFWIPDMVLDVDWLCYKCLF